MNIFKKYTSIGQVIVYQKIAFAVILLLIWLDEIIDIPYLLLGAERSLINWRESLFESICISIVGVVITRITNNIIQRMKHLEGILPMCVSCKKIKDDNGNWHQIESYIQKRSNADVSHGICPECAEKLYPDINPYKNK